MWKEFCHTSENGTHIAHKYRMSDTQREDYNISGNNIINFLFSANKGSEPLEINKVASGGELSRLMLCFSYLISGVLPMIH